MLSSIYHITTCQVFEGTSKSNIYTPASFQTEGFIHCSFAHQVASVLTRFYFNVPDLILLEIIPQRLTCPVVTENLEGGEEMYPHIYGELPLDAVVMVHQIAKDDAGNWILPGVLLQNSR